MTLQSTTNKILLLLLYLYFFLSVFTSAERKNSVESDVLLELLNKSFLTLWHNVKASPLTCCVFPCVDGNCIHMVDTGIVQKLLELLDRHVEEGNVTVQHAALSALRNLAIPGELLPLCVNISDTWTDPSGLTISSDHVVHHHHHCTVTSL